MTNAVLDTIAARRSHRAYQDTPVTQAQLDALLVTGAYRDPAAALSISSPGIFPWCAISNCFPISTTPPARA